MMQSNWSPLAVKALEAALEAGQQILSIYTSGDLEVQLKGDDSPLTRADLASHAVIKRHLVDTGIPVLSEEGRAIPYEERKHWDRLWIVDPIDGTKEFIKRNGEFTVNIALVEHGVPVLGVVLVPAFGNLFLGEAGQGAFLAEGLPLDEPVEAWLREAQPIPLSHENRPFTAVASRSHMSPETEAYIAGLGEEFGEVELISKGSSLKLCMVASGAADCYPRFAPTMEWDTAAGQAVCLAAGCEVIDWENQVPLRYNRPELLNPWFLVKGPRMQ